MGSKLIDLTGRVFGRWTVQSHSHYDPLRKVHYWHCVCECGNEKDVVTRSLTRGDSKSCGCLQKEGGHWTHGMTKTKIYDVWRAMKNRCFKPNTRYYENYGGRGITVCNEWLDFINFFNDMGFPPKNHWIERIDVNGNYEPSNCRWATPKEQGNNRTDNSYLTHNGETLNITQWAEKLKIPRPTIVSRLSRGWGLDRVFSKKTFKSGPKPIK